MVENKKTSPTALKYILLIAIAKRKLFLITFFLIISISFCFSQTRIKMEENHGVYTLPCTVNGIELRFIFDTGASDVCLSLSEAIFMLKNGYMSEEDLLGASQATLGDGNIIENTQAIIRELKIGDITLRNVKATIVHKSNAPLLLGQSAIRQLGTIQLNGEYLEIMRGQQSASNTQSALDALGNYERGYNAFSNELYDLAITYFKMYLESNPNSDDAYCSIGTAYIKLSNFNQAMIYLKKAIELTPNNAYAYINIGVAYADLGNFNAAIGSLKKAIEINPKDEGAYSSLGLTYRKLEDYNQAIMYYKKVVEINPSNADGYSDIGSAYGKLGEYNQAIKNYRKAIEINPNDTRAYYNIAFTYYNLKDYNQAILNYKKTIEIDPSYIYAYIDMGFIYDEQKNYNDAIASFKKAVSINSKESNVYFILGNTYIKVDNYIQAVESFQKAALLGHKASQDLLTKKGYNW